MINMDVVNREIEAGRAELAASDKAILSLATRLDYFNFRPADNGRSSVCTVRKQKTEQRPEEKTRSGGKHQPCVP